MKRSETVRCPCKLFKTIFKYGSETTPHICHASHRHNFWLMFLHQEKHEVWPKSSIYVTNLKHERTHKKSLGILVTPSSICFMLIDFLYPESLDQSILLSASPTFSVWEISLLAWYLAGSEIFVCKLSPPPSEVSLEETYLSQLWETTRKFLGGYILHIICPYTGEVPKY